MLVIPLFELFGFIITIRKYMFNLPVPPGM